MVDVDVDSSISSITVCLDDMDDGVEGEVHAVNVMIPFVTTHYIFMVEFQWIYIDRYGISIVIYSLLIKYHDVCHSLQK